MNTNHDALREALNESWFLACKEIIDRCVAPDMYANARQLLDLAMRKSLSQPMPEAAAPGYALMCRECERLDGHHSVGCSQRSESPAAPDGCCEGKVSALCPGCPRAAAPDGAKPEREIEQLIRERDQRDEIIDRLCDAVLGSERPEWSSAYGFDDAVADVEGRIDELLQPSVSKAWDRFERASTAQPQAQSATLRQCANPDSAGPEQKSRFTFYAKDHPVWRVRYYGSLDLKGYNIYAFRNPDATHGERIANLGENSDAAEMICAAHNELAAAFIEEKETAQQLNHALREATEAPTFMGEPVAVQPPHPQPQAQGEPTVGWVHGWELERANESKRWAMKECRELREAIAKRDAALVACVEALENMKKVSAAKSAMAYLRKGIGTATEDVAWLRIDPAITQANEVLGRKEGK